MGCIGMCGQSVPLSLRWSVASNVAVSAANRRWLAQICVIRVNRTNMKPKAKGQASTAELTGRLPGDVAPSPRVVMSDGSVLIGSELAIAGLKFKASRKKRGGKKPRTNLLHSYLG